MLNMGLATKILIVLLNMIIFNSACMLIHMSNFSRVAKVLLLITGNAIIIGGTIYVFHVFGL
jgi:hypothetical protein